MGSHISSGPEVSFVAELTEALLRGDVHIPVREPRWITDQHVDTVAFPSQPNRTCPIADVVAPDVVATLVKEITEDLECGVYRLPIIRMNVVFAQNHIDRGRFAVGLPGCGHPGQFTYQPIETDDISHHPFWKVKLSSEELDSITCVQGEALGGKEGVVLFPLDAVSEEDRHRNVISLPLDPLEADSEEIGDTGQSG